MAIQRVLTKPSLRDYSDIEPLPDPPQVPDMEQFDGISAFAWALSSRCKRRDGYLVSGVMATCEVTLRTWARLRARTLHLPRTWETRGGSSVATATS